MSKKMNEMQKEDMINMENLNSYINTQKSKIEQEMIFIEKYAL